MKLNKHIFLSIVAVVFGSLAFFEYYKSQKEQNQKVQEETLFYGFKKEDVKQISIVKQSGSLVLKRVNEKWYLKKPLEDAVDMASVESMLSSLLSAKRMKLDKKNLDFSKYGLSKKATKIILDFSKGSQRIIYLSSKLSFDKKRFVRFEGEDGVYLAVSSIDSILDKTVDTVRSRKLFPDQVHIDEVIFKKGKQIIHLIKNRKKIKNADTDQSNNDNAQKAEEEAINSPWVLKNNKSIRLSSEKVIQFINTFKYLEAKSFIRELPTKMNIFKPQKNIQGNDLVSVLIKQVSQIKNLLFGSNKQKIQSYGLQKPNISIKVFVKNKPIWFLRLKENQSKKTVFAFASHRPTIFSIDLKGFEKFSTSLFDLRDKSYMFQFDKTSVGEVSLGGKQTVKWSLVDNIKKKNAPKIWQRFPNFTKKVDKKNAKKKSHSNDTDNNQENQMSEQKMNSFLEEVKKLKVIKFLPSQKVNFFKGRHIQMLDKKGKILLSIRISPQKHKASHAREKGLVIVKLNTIPELLLVPELKINALYNFL